MTQGLGYAESPCVFVRHNDTDHQHMHLLLCRIDRHGNRLNLYARFGSEEYAREELRAELASALLGAQLGVPMASSMMESHASYLASWLTVLKRDKNEIFRAAADAQKIADYLGQWAIAPTAKSKSDVSHAATTGSDPVEAKVAARMRR